MPGHPGSPVVFMSIRPLADIYSQLKEVPPVPFPFIKMILTECSIIPSRFKTNPTMIVRTNGITEIIYFKEVSIADLIVRHEK